nr:extracellular solute-binding protein [uncultured Acetatifactor sp.]
MKRKAMAAFMAAIMTASLLAGCGDNASQSSGEGSSSAGGDSAGEESSAGEEGDAGEESSGGGSGSEEASGDLKTLHILGVDHSGTDGNGQTVKLSDWVNGDSKLWERFTSDLAERGLKLELDLIENDQYDTTVNNQLAAGLDYDFVYITPLSTKTRIGLVEQGKLQPLNQIWNQYGQEATKEFYEQGAGSEVVKLNVLEDGNIYWVSTAIIGTYGDSNFGSFTMPQIRKDWLDKLGLEMPQTTDELYEALKAFRENDVNGNGEADEVARLSLSTFSGGIAQLFGLGNSIAYVDYYTGKVSSPWYDENVKEYIRFMQKLYDEGMLVDGDSESTEVAENKAAMIFDWALETWQEPTIMVPEGEAAPYYVGVHCKAVEGVEPLIARQRGIQKAGYDYAATDKADPEAVAIYLDYIASEEYALLSEFGIEGFSFEYDENGEMVQYSDSEDSEVQMIVKTPALWVNNGIAPRVQKVDRKQEVDMTKGAGYDMGYPEEGFEEKVKLIRDIYENEEKYSYAAMSVDMAVSTVAENDEVDSFYTDLDTRSKEILMNLIMGTYSLEDWDTYISDLQNLGLDKLIEIYQNRYNRAWGN